MKASQKAIELIKTWEGCKLEAYLCSANVWTIGVGTTKGVKPGMKITQAQADEMLHRDLAEFESAITRLVKVPLTQNQADALICFVYNIGIGAFSGSTLLKKLNTKDYAGAANEFGRWTKAGGKVLLGLERRRKAEKQLFLS